MKDLSIIPRMKRSLNAIAAMNILLTASQLFFIICLVMVMVPITSTVELANAQPQTRFIQGDIYLLSRGTPYGEAILRIDPNSGATSLLAPLPVIWGGFSYDPFRDMLIAITDDGYTVRGVGPSGNVVIIAGLPNNRIQTLVSARGDGLIYVYNGEFLYIDAFGNVQSLTGSNYRWGLAMNKMFYHRETNALFLAGSAANSFGSGNWLATLVIKIPLNATGTRVEGEIQVLEVNVSSAPGDDYPESASDISYGPVPLFGNPRLFFHVGTNSGFKEPRMLTFDPFTMGSFEVYAENGPYRGANGGAGVYNRTKQLALILDTLDDVVRAFKQDDESVNQGGQGTVFATGVSGSGGSHEAAWMLEIGVGVNSVALLSPRGGEYCEVDSKQNIVWISNSISKVNLEYSTDNGKTWSFIASNIDANNQRYLWTIPNVTSNQCKIRVTDASNPAIISESPLFMIKGYILAKLDNGVYDFFEVSQDAWSFGNTADMWPQSWWNQFDYSRPPYPPDWTNWPINARPSDFPDWPLFVDAFGESQAYLNPPPGLVIFNPSAVLKWTHIKSNWRGSCFGFAVSSFLAFDDIEAFTNEFPDLGNFVNLRFLPIDVQPRKVVNKLWIYQLGKNQLAHINAEWFKTPNETLDELKQMLLSETRDDRFLVVYNQNGSGGHALNPYRIEKDQSNTALEYIYVYDSNVPNGNNQIVTINTTLNTWNYPSLPNWGGNQGFFLMDPVRNYLDGPILSKSILPREKWISKTSIGAYIEVFSSATASTIITDLDGKIIGYSDSLTFNNFEEGIPIIPVTGSFHPPIGYFIPNGQNSIQIQSFADSSAYLSVFTDSLIYSYSRSDAQSTQTDNLAYGDGLAIKNQDGQTKTAKLEAIVIEADTEKVFEVKEFELFQSDSLHFNVTDRQNINIFNFGSRKNYDLKVRLVSTNSNIIFEHRDIALSPKTSHVISPGWDNLTNQPVQIFIDANLDGVIDDTVRVENQFTDVKDRSMPQSEIPKDYFLAQNYPNPFNPVTKIRFGLPATSEVSIEVYNIFGQRVAILLNAKKPAGYHLVEFDGSQLAGGLYFYRLQTHRFIEVRKMLLIK